MNDLFIENLERVLGHWPSGVKWSLQQVAMYTRFSASEVAGFLTVALRRKVEEDDRLSAEEAQEALAGLKTQVEEQELKKQVKTKSVLEKVGRMQAEGDFHKAYQSLVYFIGNNRENFADEEILELYHECLRIGTKAEVSAQELTVYLGKILTLHEKKGGPTLRADVEDLVDAYGEFFQKEKTLQDRVQKIIRH